MTLFQNVRPFWTGAALLLFNTLLVFLLLNGASWLWLRRFDEPAPELPRGAIERRSGAPLSPVYPELSEEEISALIEETWSRTHAYESLTGHREREFTGRFVNVHPAGFRKGSIDAPWPPPRGSIFVFGGSTTFGVGVQDDATIPAQLEERLRAATGRGIFVYNFGRGYYYSSQERALFAQLLEQGYVPAVAIFIDGLNEFILEEPAYTERLRRFMDGEIRPPSLADRLPLVAVLRGFMESAPQSDAASQAAQRAARDTAVAPVIERYLANRRLIQGMAAAWGVQTLFVWQPVPTYRYDIANHLYATRSNWLQNSGERTRNGYATFAARLASEAPDASFLWLADMQASLAEPLYVDQVHYTRAMSGRIADSIATALMTRGLIDRPPARTVQITAKPVPSPVAADTPVARRPR